MLLFNIAGSSVFSQSPIIGLKSVDIIRGWRQSDDQRRVGRQRCNFSGDRLRVIQVLPHEHEQRLNTGLDIGLCGAEHKIVVIQV